MSSAENSWQASNSMHRVAEKTVAPPATSYKAIATNNLSNSGALLKAFMKHFSPWSKIILQLSRLLCVSHYNDPFFSIAHDIRSRTKSPD
jgi:hypothetical protein